MGIDRSAFTCFGARIAKRKTIDPATVDSNHINAVIMRHANHPNVAIYEWGSRQYGGEWGFVLALVETYDAVDFDCGGELRKLERPSDAKFIEALNRLDAACEEAGRGGYEVVRTEEPHWFVGSRVW